MSFETKSEDIEDIMAEPVLVEPYTNTKIYQKDILFFRDLHRQFVNGLYQKSKTETLLRRKYKTITSKIGLYHIYRNHLENGIIKHNKEF